MPTHAVPSEDALDRLVLKLMAVDAPKAFIWLVVMTYFTCSMPDVVMPFSMIEFFAGDASISKSCMHSKISTAMLDVKLGTKSSSKDNPFDLSSSAGLVLLGLIRVRTNLEFFSNISIPTQGMLRKANKKHKTIYEIISLKNVLQVGGLGAVEWQSCWLPCVAGRGMYILFLCKRGDVEEVTSDALGQHRPCLCQPWKPSFEQKHRPDKTGDVFRLHVGGRATWRITAAMVSQMGTTRLEGKTHVACFMVGKALQGPYTEPWL